MLPNLENLLYGINFFFIEKLEDDHFFVVSVLNMANFVSLNYLDHLGIPLNDDIRNCVLFD